MLKNIQYSSNLFKNLKPIKNIVSYSTTSSNHQQNIQKDEDSEWKKNVVVVPVQTTIDDLKRTHRKCKNGFYVSHRSYVDKMPQKYSIEPILTKRTGGYDIETGAKLFKRVGGGLPVYWHFMDFKRVGPVSGAPLVEKIIDILKTRDRTGFIALVAHADSKRYILATENMKIGDLIRTSCEIPRLPVKSNEGDAHPLGALPIGTKIHNVERYPGLGGSYCHAAGSSAEITGHLEDRVIVKLPSNLSLSLDRTCMATVGQVSHASNKDEKMSHPADKRDLGFRPRSGLWQRKDGYAGRKIHPPKKIKVIGANDNDLNLIAVKVKYSYSNWSLTD